MKGKGITILMMISIVAIMIVGCGGTQNKIVGKWIWSNSVSMTRILGDDYDDYEAEREYIFNDNGTYEYTQYFQYKTISNEVGTYTISDNTITLFPHLDKGKTLEIEFVNNNTLLINDVVYTKNGVKDNSDTTSDKTILPDKDDDTDYSNKIIGDWLLDIKASNVSDSQDAYVDVYGFFFNEDGTCIYYPSYDSYIKGTYEIKGKTITILTDSGKEKVIKIIKAIDNDTISANIYINGEKVNLDLIYVKND